MAGEIQLNSTTMATESSGTITLSNVNSATNRTNLGLGSMATQNANAVALTGGSLTGTEIDLKSSGTTIYKSDGTTAVLSESSGVVTLNNGTIGSGVVFPAGHIVQTVFNTHAAESSFTSSTPTAVANLTKAITLKTSNPYILVILALNSVGKLSSNTSLGVRLTADDSGSLDIKLSDMLGNNDSGSYNFGSGFQAYLHNLTSDSSGTTITYTPKFYSAANTSRAYINANYIGGGQHSQIILMEIQK